MATTQPIRNKEDIQQLADFSLSHGGLRNHVLIILGVNTALRISDLLNLVWDDVYDLNRKTVRPYIITMEQKTGKSRTIALNQSVISAISLYATESAKSGHALIENPNTGKAISRVQAYRIIRDAGEALNFSCRVSCHSLRKTLGYHAYKRGVSLATITDIYNHSSLAITRRYLGITQDDKDAVYLGLDLTS